MEDKKHVEFKGRLVLVGFGSVGQGTLPLILRHIDMPRDRISILTGDNRGRQEARQYGVKFVVNPITRENCRKLLQPLLGRGDFLLNLSVDVSSVVLMEFCQQHGALYLDTQESRGLVPASHASYVGAVRARAMQEADLVVAVGRKLDYQTGYGSPAVYPHAKWLRIGDNAEELRENRRENSSLLRGTTSLWS